MKQIFLFLIFSPTISFAQKIIQPSWKNEVNIFVAAKIKVTDGVTKKILFNDYKESSVTLTGFTGNPYSFTIDIPDFFYLKEGTLYSANYEYNNDGTESVSYTVMSGDKMAAIYISYNNISDTPTSIVVVGTDNIKAKPLRQKSIILYEFK